VDAATSAGLLAANQSNVLFYTNDRGSNRKFDLGVQVSIAVMGKIIVKII
jgi:hypothetical protein